MKFTVLKGNIYYARLDIPADVQQHFNKKIFSKSLKTSNRKQATERAAAQVYQWKQQIQAARGHDADNWELEVIRESKELDRQLADGSLTYDEWGEAGWSLHDAAMERYNFKEGSPEDIRLDHVLRTNKPTSIFNSEYLNRFTDYYKKQVKLATYISYKKPLEQLTAYFKSGGHPLDYHSVADLIQQLIDNGLSKSSINKRLGIGKLYLEWASKQRDIDTTSVLSEGNPFTGHKFKVTTTTPTKTPFTRDDVNKLLQASRTNKHYQGLHQAILIASYTGMRIEEIFQLKIDDVDLNNQTLTITESKTEAGQRTIPIHSALLDALTVAQAASTDGYIMPSTAKGVLGRRSKPSSQKFGRLRDKLGFNSSKDFHSLRRGVITQLEQAGVPEGITADIVGHEKQTITYGVYSGGTSLAQMKEAIENIKY